VGRAGADDTWLIDPLVPLAVVVGILLAAAVLGVAVVRLVGPGRTPGVATGARPLRRYLAGHERTRSFLARRLDPTETTGLLLTVALAVLVVAGVAFGAVFEMVTSQWGLYRADASAARWGADHATPATTDVLEALTQLGSTVVAVAAAAVVSVVAYVRRREARVAAFLAMVVVGEILLANVIKVAVGRERPAVLPLVHPTGMSFPSGHTTTAAAVATAIAFVLGRRQARLTKILLGVGAAAVVVVVAATRVLLGVHWLTDVVAGAFLGVGWFTVCAIAFGGRLLRFGAPVEVGQAPVSRGP
jgi:membrane-associated phospholipid phosphatase